ncbi:efflux RND transporter periplasmic adaptor subunit [Phocaeicola vulgatus]|uniref:efflux RND transporter periplasmic adaptor subunit n=1 Tax=Phocaeicola vulgatus TaxID=821 RepID=UPI003DA6C2A9
MKRIIFPIAALLLASCNHSEKPGGSAETLSAQLTDTAVETTADTLQMDGTTGATAKANPASFNGTLTVPPQNFVSVTLSMGGVVSKLLPLPGSYVRKGTLICVLENPDFIILQQTYLESRAQLEYLETEYQRQQKLSMEEAASQKRLQQSKADYLSMKSRMQAAAAQLRLLNTDPERLAVEGILPYMEVKAPASGYISNVQANLGKYMEAGTPVCDIIDKGKIMVRLTAYEKDLETVQTGVPIHFRVNGLGTKVFDGKIVSVGQQVDDANRSIELYAEVTESSPLFRPGMYVSAWITDK